MTTQTASRAYPLHNHGAWLTSGGNGNTDLDAGHFHRVIGFRVMAAPDGHTHDLTMLPCGAGAPYTVGRREELVPSYFGAGQAVTPEIQAQMDALNARQQIESKIARAALWRGIWIGAGVLAAVGAVIGAFVYFRED